VVTSSAIAWKSSVLLGAVAALHLALTAPSRSTRAPDARARLARVHRLGGLDAGGARLGAAREEVDELPPHE
jgi:hypothetical protein